MVIDVAADVDLTIGSHLVTKRLGYTHHGVYAGAGKVVHYTGLSRSLHRGPVQEVTLKAFAHGHPVWIRQCPSARFAGREAVRRAYSRLGENRYRLISNNCEHFCMWCLHGESRSEQIDVWKLRAIDVLDPAVKAIRQLGSVLRIASTPKTTQSISNSAGGVRILDAAVQVSGFRTPVSGSCSC
ncbi:hypothetical protein PSAC2689_50416 [Paraburkholderia sacchari]